MLLEDLIRALHRLDPVDDATRRAIGQVLGFDIGIAAQKGSPDAVPSGSTGEPDITPRRPPRPPRKEPKPLPVRDAAKSLDFTVTEIASATPQMPDWVSGGDDTVLLPRAKDGATFLAPSIQPLFRPLWERSILATLFATYENRGAMDVGNVVDQLSRGQVVTSLPRLPVPTLAKGVQVLVDRSPGMLPFQEDLKQILRSIRSLMGNYALQVLRFSGVPLRGAGKGSPFTWTAYEEEWLPARGTRVVCLTDLGIGRPPGQDTPATPGEWLSFQTTLQRHDCSLAVITPYGTDRWPAALQGVLNIVHWDDNAHSAAIKRALRK